MKHYKFGYARVSTEQQNLDRQLDMLTRYGVDYIFNEKMTGTKRDRPQLNKLLDRMMEGDTVVIESLSRLGRSTKDLIELVDLFEQSGVHLVSLKEQIDTSAPAGKLLFTLMSEIAQFEQCHCRTNQRGLTRRPSARVHRRQTEDRSAENQTGCEAVSHGTVFDQGD